MFECWNCDRKFDEPDVKRTTYEDYYGVGSMFPNHHSMEYECCPYCGSEDIHEVEEEEEEEE